MSRGCRRSWREWKNGRGVLSLSESLSLFFPLPPLPPRRQAHDRKLPSQATHTTRVPFQDTTKTRPVHKLDTVRSHGAERPMNTPAKRLALDLLAMKA